VYQTKLVVDMRDPSTTAGTAGVACNGTTDDTGAIQAYLNYYGNGGVGVSNVELQLPVGNCKISNELVYEGTNAYGIRLVGTKGQNGGQPGTQLMWYGAELRHHDADIWDATAARSRISQTIP
jgi:hypothetical protein